MNDAKILKILYKFLSRLYCSFTIINMAADLTPENFIMNIKNMNDRDRKKLRAEDIIRVILQVPDNFIASNNQVNFDNKLLELSAAIDFVKSQAINNTAEIAQIKLENTELRNVNASLNNDNNSLAEQVNNIDSLVKRHDKHLNGIEQYLRVNNLEVVGLPVADDPGVSVENTLLEIFNKIPDLNGVITEDDIDISHVIPSNRSDKKIVAVCRFVSRKTKIKILEAKKKCRDFKFKDEFIFINDHLSPINRHLFALASGKKKQLGYKFLWTKQGSIFMRKDEHAEVILIDDEATLDGLTNSHL